MPDWKKIKAEYIRGGVSYRKLADKYGVSFSQLMKVGANEKWTDLRKKSDRKAEEKLVESVASQEAKRAVNLLDTADALLRKIAKQMAEADYIEPQEVSAYMVAMERYKRICDVRSKADIDEQQARIDKLRKEAMVEEQSKDIRVVIDTGLEDFSK